MDINDCTRCAIEVDADRHDYDPGPLWSVPHTCQQAVAEAEDFTEAYDEAMDTLVEQPWQFDDGVVIVPSKTQFTLVEQLRAYNLDRAAAKLAAAGSDGDTLTNPDYEQRLLRSKNRHPSNRFTWVDGDLTITEPET